MTYEQALQFWFGRINYEQRTIRPGDLKLDRMRALLDALGNPHQALRLVHIAGSKGKGSTAATLASVLSCAGLRTGLFTSPHLCDVRERIEVDGVPIAPAELADLMADVAPVVGQLDAAADRASAGVTFFEIGTALGFLHFLRRQVDVAVLEVGLGGRFDATNVCDPALSIITSISFDHTQQLGNTLARIAFEKAGIIKPGRPVISGVTAPEARPVIRDMSHQQQAPLRELGQEIHYTYTPGLVSAGAERWPVVHVVTDRQPWPPLRLKLLGEHQAANAALVVAAVEELRGQGLPIPAEAVAAGLAEVHWPARLEVVRRRPLVILDCAHNVASAQVLLNTLRESFPLAVSNGTAAGGAVPRPPSRFLVFAGSSDKDLSGMLQVLAPGFQHLFLTRYAHNPRYVSPEQLAQLLQRVSVVPFTACASAPEAWRQAYAAAGPEDLICITGSVFLAGELRPLVLAEEAVIPHEPSTTE
jgi:dihydrofolate synthase/folylpolyglutamate synthase